MENLVSAEKYIIFCNDDMSEGVDVDIHKV